MKVFETMQMRKKKLAKTKQKKPNKTKQKNTKKSLKEKREINISGQKYQVKKSHMLSPLEH